MNRWRFLHARNLTNALERSGNQFAARLPRLIGVVLLMGLVNVLVPGELLASFFSGSAILDTLWGHASGALSPGIL